MWRLWLKTWSASLFGAMRLGDVVAASRGGRMAPLILGYHRVVADFQPDPTRALPSMQISAAMLESQLDWVARRYDIVALDEIARSLEHGERPRRPLAAVTLDDGYRDAYEVAFPLFRRKGIPAAFFLVTDLVGSNAVPIYDRIYFQLARGYARDGRFPDLAATLLRERGFLTPAALARLQRSVKPYDALQELLERLSQRDLRLWVEGMETHEAMPAELAAAVRCLEWDMVRTMAAAGMVIGSHTRTHAFLNREAPHVAREEAAGSKQRLEAELGLPVRHFAYPAGQFDPDAVAAVAAAGYRFGYTICRHDLAGQPLLTIPRRVLWERSCVDHVGRFSGSVMAAQVGGFFDLLSPPCTLDHRPKPAPALVRSTLSQTRSA
jgi:peptidoglycan/xylan/chitin deacetylase (PgdA/CDA1 family)